jgi:hypothetical protein
MCVWREQIVIQMTRSSRAALTKVSKLDLAGALQRNYGNSFLYANSKSAAPNSLLRRSLSLSLCFARVPMKRCKALKLAAAAARIQIQCFPKALKCRTAAAGEYANV